MKWSGRAVIQRPAKNCAAVFVASLCITPGALARVDAARRRDCVECGRFEDRGVRGDRGRRSRLGLHAAFLDLQHRGPRDPRHPGHREGHGLSGAESARLGTAGPAERTSDNAGIERLGLPCIVEAFRKLPRLEDALDLGNEGWDFRLKGRLILGGLQVVQELLLNEVCESLLRSELVLDASGCLALLDPDFAQALPRARMPFVLLCRLVVASFCQNYGVPRRRAAGVRHQDHPPSKSTSSSARPYPSQLAHADLVVVGVWFTAKTRC